MVVSIRVLRRGAAPAPLRRKAARGGVRAGRGEPGVRGPDGGCGVLVRVRFVLGGVGPRPVCTGVGTRRRRGRGGAYARAPPGSVERGLLASSQSVNFWCGRGGETDAGRSAPTRSAGAGAGAACEGEGEGERAPLTGVPSAFAQVVAARPAAALPTRRCAGSARWVCATLPPQGAFSLSLCGAIGAGGAGGPVGARRGGRTTRDSRGRGKAWATRGSSSTGVAVGEARRSRRRAEGSGTSAWAVQVTRLRKGNRTFAVLNLEVVSSKLDTTSKFSGQEPGQSLGRDSCGAPVAQSRRCGPPARPTR